MTSVPEGSVNVPGTIDFLEDITCIGKKKVQHIPTINTTSTTNFDMVVGVFYLGLWQPAYHGRPRANRQLGTHTIWLSK